MSELKNAYFAGIVDGEGNVDVYPHLRGTSFRPVIKVKMTCETTVRALLEYFGGSFTRRAAQSIRHKPQFEWSVSWSRAVAVAKQIRPYLITKAANADRIIAFTPQIRRRGPDRQPRKKRGSPTT
jgi:hypothetical protein